MIWTEGHGRGLVPYFCLPSKCVCVWVGRGLILSKRGEEIHLTWRVLRAHLSVLWCNHPESDPLIQLGVERFNLRLSGSTSGALALTFSAKNHSKLLRRHLMWNGLMAHLQTRGPILLAHSASMWGSFRNEWSHFRWGPLHKGEAR